LPSTQVEQSRMSCWNSRRLGMTVTPHNAIASRQSERALVRKRSPLLKPSLPDLLASRLTSRLLQSFPSGASSMRHLLVNLLLVSLCLAQSAAPSPAKTKVLWQKLQASIEQVDQHLDGVMGVAIEDITTGDHYFLNEDEVFAQASSIKITVLVNLYLQAQQGKLKLTDLYTVQASDLVPDSDIMNGLTPGVTRVTLRDL